MSLAYSLYQEALPALSLGELVLDRPFHLKIHEDNQATILVAKKGFSSELRCVQRTHKVNLACVAEQLESDHISKNMSKQTCSQQTFSLKRFLPTSGTMPSGCSAFVLTFQRSLKMCAKVDPLKQLPSALQHVRKISKSVQVTGRCLSNLRQSL